MKQLRAIIYLSIMLSLIDFVAAGCWEWKETSNLKQLSSNCQLIQIPRKINLKFPDRFCRLEFLMNFAVHVDYPCMLGKLFGLLAVSNNVAV